MTTRKVAKQLSNEGRRRLAVFLAENLNDRALHHLISAWEQDVTFDLNDCTEGYIEIAGYQAKNGNPATLDFQGEDELIFEDIEDEE